MIKKNNTSTLTISADISKAFFLLLKQKNLHHITISDVKVKHIKELNHILTNRLFNSLHKKYRNETLNYLFVIEYGSAVSKSNVEVKYLDEHAHIVLSSSLHPNLIKNQIDFAFNKQCNCLFQNLSERNDKENLVGYLLKQKQLLQKENYNYKISLDKPTKNISND